MAEIGSVQPGAGEPPDDASAGPPDGAVEPGAAAPDAVTAPPDQDATAEAGVVRLAVVGDPATPAAARATSFLQRAVLRRRIRFLRRRRELALHDLGGFVYETHRLGESRPELTAGKLEGMDAIDGELATLERALALGEELIVLHEPGVSSCRHCSTIHDSAARYCPGCGRPV